MKETIQKYFKAWLNADIDILSDIFSNDIIYSECYGPEYHGITQILKWFDDWNQKGKVLEWTIKRSIEKENTIVVEWFFKCEFEGNIEGFDGVTIADFDKEGKIKRLCEFQSKHDHYYPYGELI